MSAGIRSELACKRVDGCGVRSHKHSFIKCKKFEMMHSHQKTKSDELWL